MPRLLLFLGVAFDRRIKRQNFCRSFLLPLLQSFAVTRLFQFSKMLIFIFSLVGCLWITAAAEELLVVTILQNVSVSLNCTAQRKHGVDYRAVRWYKESIDPRLTGLVSRTPPSGMLKWYVGADLRVFLEYPSLNLQLPPVSCADTGVYQCHMAAPVGEQNREGRVRLKVIGCPTDPPMTRKEDVDVIPCSFSSRNDGYLLICGAVAVLFVSLAIFLLSYKWLKNAFWHNTKTPGKEPYPDPNSLPEKQDLLWITTLGPPPKKSDITAA